VKRIGLALFVVTLTGVLACQREDNGLTKKLDEISQRLSAIEAKLGNAPAGAARPPQQPRAQPNPASVHAVSIGESAVIGSKLAKVTIVEAFTFT
jgi:hypothetical protein